MYAIYGNMDPINIPQMLAYIPAPWIRHGNGIVNQTFWDRNNQNSVVRSALEFIFTGLRFGN